jgi:hypothetical protein
MAETIPPNYRSNRLMLLESDGESTAQPILWPHFVSPEGLIWTPPRLALPVAGEATRTSASRAGPASLLFPTAAARAETPLPLALTTRRSATPGGLKNSAGARSTNQDSRFLRFFWSNSGVDFRRQSALNFDIGKSIESAGRTSGTMALNAPCGLRWGPKLIERS